MEILTLLDRAHEAGLTMRAVDGDVVIRGPRQAEAIVRELMGRKAEVLAALADPPAALRRGPTVGDPEPGIVVDGPDQASSMLAAAVGKVRARGASCVLCREHTHDACIWAPSPPVSRYLGVPAGKHKAFVHALCAGCAADPDYGRRVEDLILRNRQARLAAADAGLEIEDGFVPFGNQADLERFAAAYTRNAPPADPQDPSRWNQ